MRRTFLENVIQHLADLDWIDKAQWEQTREELAQRRRITETRSIPRLGKLGSLLAFSVLLIPVGLALLNAGLRQTSSMTPPTFDWMMIAGISLTLIPVIIYSILVVPRLIGWCWRKLWGKPTTSDDLISFGALIAQKHITDTRTETIENPNPTSVEFEEIFDKLMTEALDKHDRRLILSLDNLDRVTSTDALSILAALQTFLKYSDHNQPKWFSKIYVLIPYDPNGLKRLWASQDEDESTRVTTAFLDKTFQVRFEVPPLLLSDWRIYFIGLLNEALPDHDKTEFHSAYRVFALHIRDGISPTPRDLKLFVNQIGTITRQWQNSFPLADIAYYILLRRKATDVPAGLLDKTLPESKLSGLMSDNAQSNLAAMAFNVPVKQARQILLQTPIETALSERQVDDLKELSEFPGFREVLLDIPFSDWSENESVKLANAAYCLGQDGVFDVAEPELRTMVINSLRAAAYQVNSWKPLDARTAEGLIALLELIQNPALAEAILKALPPVSTEEEQQELGVTEAWVAGLLRLLRGLQLLGFDSAYLNGIELGASAYGYIDVCIKLYDQDADGDFWKIIMPPKDGKEVSFVLQTLAKEESLTIEHVHAMQVMKKGQYSPEWREIGSTIVERLKADDTKQAAYVHAAMATLWELHDLDSVLEKQIGQLATEGHLLHYLHHARKENVTAAWCAFMYLWKVPSVPSPASAGNSNDGYNYLVGTIFTDPANYDKFTQEFIKLLADCDKLDLLFEVFDAAPASKPWIIECLRIVQNKDYTLEVYSPEIIIQRWQVLRSELNEEEYSHLLEKLIEDSSLVESVYADPFEVEKAALYFDIAQNGGDKDKAFIDWTQKGLGDLSKDGWLSELKSEGFCLRLLFHMLATDVIISLRTPYQDALIDYSKLVVSGKAKPKNHKDEWALLFDALDSTGRSFLQAQLLKIAERADGKIAGDFFDLYGEEITAYQTLVEDHDIVMNLFIPLLRDNNERGLQWVELILSQHPNILDKYNSSAADAFKARILEKLEENPEDTIPVILKIAEILNLHPSELASSKDYEDAE